MASLGTDCLVCGSSGWQRLGRHLKKDHAMTQQEYYDAYLKKDGEGLCIECGDLTTFEKNEYKRFCSKKQCQFQ